MLNAVTHPPLPENAPVKSYAPGSPERASLQESLKRMGSEHHEIHAIIGGERVTTERTYTVRAPHDHQHELATAHLCGTPETECAIAAALEARHDWARMPFDARAAIFLKTAELLDGPYRDLLNASTMLGQSKNCYQAEIDAVCELIDFLKFNVAYARALYEEQPRSAPGVWNRLQYRPLEGFVLAITPFNFTSIQANLPAAPALMGNVALWKPSNTALLSAYYIMQLFEEAGLPPGVINLLPGDGADVGDPALASPHLGGLHFTGSTGTFQHLWREIGQNVAHYRSYPRIVGETGGKDFIIAHPSADVDAVATAIVRGAFEYQGQKCSAASRLYLPQSIWEAVRERAVAQIDEIKMGGVEDFSNFVNAVIDEKAFDRITGYIDQAREDGVEVVAGGGYDKSEGYFIEPTFLRTDDPKYRTMREELFGPVVTAYVYDDSKPDAYADTLQLLDETSPYALTGAVFSQDRAALLQAQDVLLDNAGNFYLNDKPTGAVVGQQPFGGARGSGTNDKAGSPLNLLRWVSARTVKETFVPPKHFGYPFLADNEGAI